MAEWFQSGQIALVIAASLLAEGVALSLYRHFTGRGLPLGDITNTVLSGVFLLLALYLALIDSAWPGIAAALFAALLAHIGDLHRRWPR